MPILSNFSTGGDAEDYVSIHFYDWDDTPLGSIVVPKGEDASAAVTAFENTLKATAFDEGSQYYSSDESKPLTNKKGYSFGVWIPRGSEAFTHYGASNSPTSSGTVIEIPQPEAASFAGMDGNLEVKAAYCSNAEMNTVNAAGMNHTIEVVGYGRHSITYSIDLRIRRQNEEGQGVPRLGKAALRLCFLMDDETDKAFYYIIDLENRDEQTVTIYASSLFKRVAVYVGDSYDSKGNITGIAAKSKTLLVDKGTAAEKDGFVYLGTMRHVNDYLASSGKIGSFSIGMIGTDLGIDILNPETGNKFGTVALRNRLYSAWRTKNPEWESENPPPFVDLTWDEMQYAISNDGALMPEGGE